jgi:copper chaperone CopZ
VRLGKIMMIGAVLSSLASPVLAASAAVTINGMVCAFCVAGIEKLLSERPEVSASHIDLDAKLVKIDFKDGKTLDDAAIRKIVTDSGFDMVKIERVQ